METCGMDVLPQECNGGTGLNHTGDVAWKKVNTKWGHDTVSKGRKMRWNYN